MQPSGQKGQPAMQVVGFRVEGVQPSPENNTFLGSTHGPVGAGSPTPVIIPPTFHQTVQRDNSGSRSTALDAAAHAAVGEIIPPAPTSSTGGVAPGGGTAPATAEPTEGVAINKPAPPPASSLVPPSQPKPILQPERAEAGHLGLQREDSTPSITNSASISNTSTSLFAQSEDIHFKPSSTTPTATPTSSSHAQQRHQHKTKDAPAAKPTAPPPPPPAAAAASAGAASGGGAGADKPRSQKEMTKAERRALQEAQRAAKAAGQAPPPKVPAGKKEGTPGPGSTTSAGGAKDSGKLDSKASVRTRELERPGSRDERRADSTVTSLGGTDSTSGAAPTPSAVAKLRKQATKVVSVNSTELFAHLPQFKKVTLDSVMSYKDISSLHPAVLQLGLKYADGSITGASARCMAMLNTFCQVIEDYTTPEGKSLARDMTQHLNSIIAFLVECRPLAVSMGNAIKFLKMRISQIDPATPEAEAKAHLVEEIKEFIRSRLEQADTWLAHLAAQKIESNDVILTFAYSHIVASVLLKAAKEGKRFRAVIMDSRPEYEGKHMLEKLQQAGIACTYAHFNALSFVMRNVTKVFLGASAVMSNGTVMGRAGNAAVAMVAHAHSKPVILCCESFKFHERVQLDAITHNELGDPDVLAHVPDRPEVHALQDWKATPRLGLLNLKYDAMPAEYVTVIVTEHAMIPSTSVPVIIREYQQYVRET